MANTAILIFFICVSFALCSLANETPTNATNSTDTTNANNTKEGENFGKMMNIAPEDDGSIPANLIYVAAFAVMEIDRKYITEYMDVHLNLEINHAERVPWVILNRIFKARKQQVDGVKYFIDLEVVGPLFANFSYYIKVLDSLGKNRTLQLFREYRWQMNDKNEFKSLEQYEKDRIIKGMLLAFDPKKIRGMTHDFPGETAETWKVIVFEDKDKKLELLSSKFISRVSLDKLKEESKKQTEEREKQFKDLTNEIVQ